MKSVDKPVALPYGNNDTQISVEKFDSFLVRIEEGYNRHGNPYHNACHGADVAQTIHYMLHGSGLEVCPLLACESCY